MEAQFAEAVARLTSMGGEQALDFDFSPLADTAVLLYGAAFVAERYAGIRAFLEARAVGLEPPELADLSIDTRLLKVCLLASVAPSLCVGGCLLASGGRARASGFWLGYPNTDCESPCIISCHSNTPPNMRCAALKVTRSIIAKTENWSAADVFEGLQQLSVLKVWAWGQGEIVGRAFVAPAIFMDCSVARCTCSCVWPICCTTCANTPKRDLPQSPPHTALHAGQGACSDAEDRCTSGAYRGVQLHHQGNHGGCVSGCGVGE